MPAHRHTGTPETAGGTGLLLSVPSSATMHFRYCMVDAARCSCPSDAVPFSAFSACVRVCMPSSIAFTCVVMCPCDCVDRLIELLVWHNAAPYLATWHVTAMDSTARHGKARQGKSRKSMEPRGMAPHVNA